MRYIIYGAGAIGGGIGALLQRSGHDVMLIARGPHLEAMRSEGLRVVTPSGVFTVEPSLAGHLSEIGFRADDVVLLTMKSQDTRAALEALRDLAPDVPVVCAQNGVANERMALRLFQRVYGMVVWMPGVHIEPGVVVLHAEAPAGILDVGRYPYGSDELGEMIAADLTASGLSSRPDGAIMRLKYAKLVQNVGNAVSALCGTEAAAGEIIRPARSEAVACYEAAGIDLATGTELRERTSEIVPRVIEGAPREGGSTWQSLARGTGSAETDYLNGEIVLLGALHGVPTPFNRMLQVTMAEAAREMRPPGSYAVEELISRAGAPR